MSSTEKLRDFVNVLNTHDLGRIMSFFCEDCIFFASAGEIPNGTAYRGLAEVRGGFEKIFGIYPDAVWSQDSHFVSGNRGFSEWTFSGTTRAGEQVVVRGCDAFVFRGDSFQVKDSFRKQP